MSAPTQAKHDFVARRDIHSEKWCCPFGMLRVKYGHKVWQWYFVIKTALPFLPEVEPAGSSSEKFIGIRLV
jgi:hypothetical protein